MVQQSIIDARKAPALTLEMHAGLDALVSAPLTGSEVNDLTARLKRAIIERALNAEMSLHLGYASVAGAFPFLSFQNSVACLFPCFLLGQLI
jgi:hypothetical protein